MISNPIQNRDLDNSNTFKEIYSYDMGRVVEGFADLFHYEWDMMKDFKEADNPEFIPLYNAAAVQVGMADTRSGIALLDDDSNRLVYFGEIEDSYKSSFRVCNYSDLIVKIVKPILDKSNIQINKYPAEEINALFGGTSQDIWDFLCTELDHGMLVSLTQFGYQDLIKAIIANESLPKELKALAALHATT